MPHLSAQHHYLAPDLLGFGESSRPGAYSIATQVDCLHSLLAALRISRCRLVGHSLGAWVAGQYALTYPDQVLSLAVLAPEGVSAPGRDGRWRRDRWLVAPWSPLPLVLPWLGKNPWAKALRDRRRCLRQSPAACKLLFQRRAAAIQGEMLGANLGQLAAPTLVLGSPDADPVIHRLTQAWLHQLTGPEYAEVAPADGPLGVDSAALATALQSALAKPSQGKIAPAHLTNASQTLGLKPLPGQPVTPLGQRA
jgi:pimeloyl-ACP methyl ester carboxylesterase